MQVIFEGQSLSTRHSGSSASIARIRQAHAVKKSWILKLFLISTYALHKMQNRLLLGHSYICRSLYGLWRYIQHQSDSCQDYREVDIPCEWSHYQEQNHRLHLSHIHYCCYSLLRYMQPKGFLVNQQDKHRWQYESLLHTELGYHKRWSSKDLHTPEIYISYHEDSHCLLDTHLKSRGKLL